MRQAAVKALRSLHDVTMVTRGSVWIRVTPTHVAVFGKSAQRFSLETPGEVDAALEQAVEQFFPRALGEEARDRG